MSMMRISCLMFVCLAASCSGSQPSPETEKPKEVAPPLEAPMDGGVSTCGPHLPEHKECLELQRKVPPEDLSLYLIDGKTTQASREYAECKKNVREHTETQRAAYQKCRCRQGDGQACEDLARKIIVWEGDAVDREKLEQQREYRRKAGAAYFASCSLDSPESCYKAGELWCKEIYVSEVDDPTPIDDVLRGKEAYSKGCDGGHSESCVKLAVLLKWHFRDDGEPHNAREAFQKARKLLERSCQESDEGCSRLATLVRDGNGGPRDCVRAREIEEKACDEGHGGSMHCGLVARFLYMGFCGPKNIEKARFYYERMCNARSMAVAGSNPCIALGQMCEKGVGGPKDMDCAREAYQNECMEWKKAGCPHLERITGEPQKPKSLFNTPEIVQELNHELIQRLSANDNP